MFRMQMESEWKLQMEETTSQHLIISQMLNLSVESEEIITDYNLALPALRLDTINSWDQKLRAFLKPTTMSARMQNLVDSYRAYANTLGVKQYARASVW